MTDIFSILPKMLALLFFFLIATLITPLAFADFFGDEVFVEVSDPELWTAEPESAIISEFDTEFGLIVNDSDNRVFDVDFGPTGLGRNTIRFDVLMAAQDIEGLGPVTFSSINMLDQPGSYISGFAFVSAIGGLASGRIDFTDDSISVNFDGLTVDKGEWLEVRPNFASIPEPSCAMLIGLVGTGLTRRNRRLA